MGVDVSKAIDEHAKSDPYLECSTCKNSNLPAINAFISEQARLHTQAITRCPIAAAAPGQGDEEDDIAAEEMPDVETGFGAYSIPPEEVSTVSKVELEIKEFLGRDCRMEILASVAATVESAISTGRTRPGFAYNGYMLSIKPATGYGKASVVRLDYCLCHRTFTERPENILVFSYVVSTVDEKMCPSRNIGSLLQSVYPRRRNEGGAQYATWQSTLASRIVAAISGGAGYSNYVSNQRGIPKSVEPMDGGVARLTREMEQAEISSRTPGKK